MSDTSFFDESSEQSGAKSRIVAKYFWAWAKVVIPSAKAHGNRIAYIDLFAGPGRYKDGTVSTPILVFEKALPDPDMKRMLVTVFNDRDQENASSLSEAIGALPGIEQLKHKPQVQSEEVGTEIVKMFEKMRLIPTLFFVDPWGCKGLSLALGKPYVRANYKKALTNLEAAGKIETTPPVDKGPKRHGLVTFADSVVIAFPRRTGK
jgi:three-Cys-motif partner protein